MSGEVEMTKEKRIKQAIEGIMNIPDDSRDFKAWLPFQRELRVIGKPAVPYLIETLESQRDKLTPFAKISLLLRLGCLCDERAVKIIISYIDDDSRGVHEAAETALSRIASPGLYVFFDSSEQARAWWQEKKAKRERGK